MINLPQCITQFERQAETIRAAVDGMDREQARWKPDGDSWSILEVINHLYDEEREDFRTRLKHVLDQAEGLPPPIDPRAWVVERRYNERDLTTSVANFMQERQASVAWLRGLDSPDWDNAVEGPFGRLTAGDFLMAWLAHDLLHMRQIVALIYAYHQDRAAPYSVDYAGGW